MNEKIEANEGMELPKVKEQKPKEAQDQTPAVLKAGAL
jgi:hypothetical protein